MKTRRGLVVVMASLVLSLLSLSISFTVTGSGHLPDQRKIVITVRIIDDGGKEITGAHVAVFQGEQHLGEGNSDAKGIAQMNVVVNTDSAVVLVLEVSKPGMETKEHTLKLGTNVPLRPPIEDIQLKPSGGSDTFILTVKAVDKEGNGIKQAHVNIYLGSFLFNNDYNVRPPTYQQDTNADGIRDFDIPMKPAKDLDITVEVSREDMQTQRRPVTLRANLVPLDQLETFKLSPRTVSALEYPTVNIKVSVQDDQGSLEGALVAVTSNALTPSQLKVPHQKRTGPDGSATVAIELMSADHVEYIALTVSKPGYKEFKRDIPVNNKNHIAVGTTVEVSTISLEKLAKVEGARSVTVKVRDADHPNTPVADATVVLDSKLATGYYSEPTNASGEVTFEVKETGGFTVRISQDNYEPLTNGEVRLSPDDDSKPAEFLLKAKPKKDMAGDLIEVTVLAKASIDDLQPKPLPGANISDGRGVSAVTDANGRATLRGAYDIPQSITVTAKDFKPASKRVGAARVLTLNGKGSATFVLEPELTSNSPIRLVVEVRDAADTNKTLDAANVLLRYKGKIIGSEDTDASGEAAFNLRDSAELPLSRLRSGLRVDVQREKYQIKWSDIKSDLLGPSLDVQRVTIFLERDTDDIRRAVEALEPRVFAWNNDLRADTSGAAKTFIDKALTTRQEAQALANEIAAGIDAIVTAAGGRGMCGLAAPYLLDIRSVEAKANQKAAQIETNLKNASAAAGTCSSPAQAESLRATYRKAIQTLVEIDKLNKQAAKDHEELTAIAKKNLAAKDLIAQLRPKLANIERLQNLAAENASSAASVFGRTADRGKTLVSRQFALKAELSVLSVKAQAEAGVPSDLLKRISAMEQMLASTNTYSYGMQADQALPQSVSEAASAIGDMGRTAEAKILEVDGWACTVATLDEAVDGINTTFTNAQFEIGLAADLPKQADECLAKSTQKTNTNSSANTSTGSDTTENKPDDTTSTSTGPTKDKKPPAVDDDPGIKIAQPSKLNSQDTASGGFWESAKAGKQKVENAVNNKPSNQTNPATTGETSANTSGTNTATNTTGNKPPITVEEIPETYVDNRPLSNRPASKSANKPPAVEEIPETAGTNVASNRPASKSANKPPVVEEIPETANTNIASNRPASKSGNKPPVVEEIPETANTNVASNRPRANSPQVEEIPETSTTTNSSGGNQPNSSGTSGNSQEKENPKKEKKPKDPNKPSKWQKAGAILGAIAAAANNQNQGTTNTGGTNTGDSTGGGGQSLNLAGTWSVTTQSTGDEEMNSNFTRTNVWQIWSLGGGGWRVRQVINGQTYDENYSTVDEGGGRFRLIGRNPDGSTYEMSGTYNQSQFSVATRGITISGTRQ